MSVIFFFFWFSVAILFYSYAGYGIIIFLLNRLKTVFFFPREKISIEQTIPVTLIVTAYNEELILQEKVRNCLAIDYPAGQLQLVFITDGSADRSAELISQYPSITLLHQPERKGKYAAIKRAMQLVKTPVVIFSDANSLLNPGCIRHMMEHYADPGTGAVAGEKKILRNSGISAVGEAEGIYWRYESWMKRLDAGFYTVIGAAGELFSIRSSLFRELDDEIILDDFIISMQVCLQGYKIAYEPRAFAVETASVSLQEEEKRKVRISAGAYQSIRYLRDALNILKHPLLAFQFISRRVLRWVFCPFLLVVLFLTNILIAVYEPGVDFYMTILFLQAGFYLLALSGWFMLRSGKNAGLFAIPFYFIFMNYCQVKGFARFLKKRHTVLWEKSLRQVMESS
ncbi:MAG: glycosyltransferase family 2 protein [Chitinophagaceae bacterium]